MSKRRTNPETGILEEECWHGWQPVHNEDGHKQRINPETGVEEEERWHGWVPTPDEDGRKRRINPETGVEEEERWHGWVPTDRKHGSTVGSPRRSNKPSRNSPDYGETSASSSDSAGCLGKIVGFFVIAGIVIWLVIMAMTITVMLAPVWLGAVAVGVATGFLIGKSAARRIPTEILARTPAVEEPKRKKPRLRVSEAFLKGAINFNPHILSLVGATALYCVALTAWPFYTTPDTFTRILLSVGSVAGTVLGTIAGRRVFIWQCENGIFERTGVARQARLFAPKVALGFSIPGLFVLAGFWVAAIAFEPGPLDFTKALGFKDERQPTQAEVLAGTKSPTKAVPQRPEEEEQPENIRQPPMHEEPSRHPIPNASAAVAGNWDLDDRRYTFLPDGTYFLQISGEEPATIGFDVELNQNRKPRWVVQNDHITLDTLSARRTQRGMEYLLFPKQYTAEIVELGKERMVLRSTKDSEFLSFLRIAGEDQPKIGNNQSSYFTPPADSVARTEVLDAIRTPSEAHFGQAVVFKVNTLRVTDSWALFLGEAIQPDGKPVDYLKSKQFMTDRETTKSALEAGALYGGVDALLKKTGKTWTVVTITFDAGDVHWLDFDKRYGVPTELIADPTR